jgi:hypothetical protein
MGGGGGGGEGGEGGGGGGGASPRDRAARCRCKGSYLVNRKSVLLTQKTTKSWGENSRKLSCLGLSVNCPTSTECKIYTSFRL